MRRSIVTVVAAAATVCVAAPAEAAWQPEHRINAADPTVTDVEAAYVGTADDGTAIAVWLERTGGSARIVMSRRPVDGDWSEPVTAVDPVEQEGVTLGGVRLDDAVVLPNGALLVAFREHDPEADADHVGRVLKWRPRGSFAGEQLSRLDGTWQLESDSEGDWLATSQEYDSCACEFYAWYSSGGRPDYLATEGGMGLAAALGRRDLVHLAVLDDGVLSDELTLRTLRLNGATGSRRAGPVLRPAGPVTGMDLDANRRGDVVLGYTVRRPERAVPDRVVALRQVAGRSWGEPLVLDGSSGFANARLGAPRVGLAATGEAMVAWQTPVGGTVDVVGRVLRPGTGSARLRILANDVVPAGRWVEFGLEVDDAGRALVVLEHVDTCLDGQDCHVVSAVRTRVDGPVGDARVLLRSERAYETVSVALSESGVAAVLAVARRSTAVVARVRR